MTPSPADRTQPLPSGALALLPDPGTAPRCAPHAREIAVDGVGTALAVELVVTVELPLPWPKPVFAHPVLDGLRPAMSFGDADARVLATVPTTSAGRAIRVWRRTADATATVTIDRGDHAPAAALAVLDQDGLDGLAAAFDATVVAADPAILICTQGSHDVCCGSEGARLADIATRYWPDGAVHRVSHTGGHKFAPTALTLPDGRMWAFLGESDLAGLAAGTPDIEGLASRCRGWWGADGGAAQAAERAIWLETGRHEPGRRVAPADDAPGTFRVTDPGGDAWLVTVEPGRDIPTIACRADGGLPAKPAREWRVTDVRLASDS